MHRSMKTWLKAIGPSLILNLLQLLCVILTVAMVADLSGIEFRWATVLVSWAVGSVIFVYLSWRHR